MAVRSLVETPLLLGAGPTDEAPSYSLTAVQAGKLSLKPKHLGQEEVLQRMLMLGVRTVPHGTKPDGKSPDHQERQRIDSTGPVASRLTVGLGD